MSYRDTRFLVTLVSEDIKSYYTTRVLELEHADVRPSIIEQKGSLKGNVAVVLSH